MGICLGIFGIGIIVWLSKDIPDMNKISSLSRQFSVVIKDQNGNTLATYGDLFGEVRQLKELPPYTKNAVLAVEDKRFYSHPGIDLIGIMRAFVANRKAGRVVQGGSTITQQLAKNILITSGSIKHNNQSYKRKMQEVILAFLLERKFTKDQILTLYLNRIYLGSGTYGIDAAAQKYFGKNAPQLTLYESAILAGLLKAPSRYSPHNNFKRASDRADTVIKLMKEAGFIDNADKQINKGREDLRTFKEPHRGTNYFTDWIRDSIEYYVDIDEDLEIITTIDRDMQKSAELSVKKIMDEHGEGLKAQEVAFVAMSADGAVRAMVGGRSSGFSQFNRATQALRMAGSAIKPFIYLALLEYTDKTLQDMESDLPYEKGSWKPSSFYWKKPWGEMSYHTALVKSINPVVIRATETVGVRNIKCMLEKMGIYSEMPDNLTIALGAGSVTLLDLTAAFACFANDGRLVNPYGIVAINDKNGNPKYRYLHYETQKIMSNSSLTQMRSALNDAVMLGTGRRVSIGKTVSGKTGSNGHKDAWFLGYREYKEGDNNEGFTDIVCGAWVGNDDYSDMHEKSMGGRLPSMITKEFFLNKNG